MAAFLARRLISNKSSQILGTSSSSTSGALISISRAFSSSTTPIKATLFPGDGIGPEISESVKKVFTAADVAIEWDERYVSTEVDPRTNSFLTWWVGLNLTQLNLYANVRPCYSLTEGEYSGLEHQVVKGVVESIKIITRKASSMRFCVLRHTEGRTFLQFTKLTLCRKLMVFS